MKMNLQVILLTTCVAVAFSSPIELEEKLRTLFADERELSLKGLGVSTRGTGTGSLLSKTEKSTILKLHRQARNDVQPTASNMQKMVNMNIFFCICHFASLPIVFCKRKTNFSSINRIVLKLFVIADRNTHSL